MASYGNQFYNSLRDIFGPTKTSTLTAAAATATVPFIGRGEVYSLDFICSAAIAATFQLVDASATGIGGTVLWQSTFLPATPFVHDFVRPLLFTKGLLLNYTATGAATLNANVQWSPDATSV